MPIDWFTVVAQGVNFLILVALLRRFLYGPIQRAVAAREEKLQSRLQEASEKGRRADEREAELARRQEELDTSRDRLVADARAKADAERRSLVAAARRDVDRARSEWLESFAQQRDAVTAQFASATADAACEIARRTLRDLADAPLEEKLVARLLEHLGSLKTDERTAFAEAARAADGRLTVRTGFPLSPEQRAALEAGLARIVDRKPRLEFVATDHAAAGISVEASGRRIAWTLEGYVDEIQARLAATLDEELDRIGPTAAATTPKEDRTTAGASPAATPNLVPSGNRPQPARDGGGA